MQNWTQEQYNEYVLRQAGLPGRNGSHKPVLGSSTLPPAISKKRKITKTEAEYGLMLHAEFKGCRILFEAISLKMSNGHRYTPDWVVFKPNGKILLIEIKHRGRDGFRQASYSRAKLAYDQCTIEFPAFEWRWVEKHKGEWAKI